MNGKFQYLVRDKTVVCFQKGKGPFPGVIDMFGTSGGTIEHRSALLASRGIASLALCYYLPEFVKELEYFVSAVKYLLAHPKVSSLGVGVVGTSKGSEMAYLLSIVCPKVNNCLLSLLTEPNLNCLS